MSNPLEFADAFRRGYLNDVTTDDLVGRIIYGRTVDDFTTISKNQAQLSVLMSNPINLANSVGRKAFDLLLLAGWDYASAVKQINEDYIFKLIVYKNDEEMLPTNWDNLKEGVIIDLKVELPAAAKPRIKRVIGQYVGFPSYYKPEDVGRRYVPRLEEVTEEAKAANLTPASQDKSINTLVCIDCQRDFVMPEIKALDGTVLQEPGSLLVGGAVDDVRRIIEMIYMYPYRFNRIIFSKDMHVPRQIFFPPWLVDRNNEPIAPFTYLTEQNLLDGDYRPVCEEAWTFHYLKQVKGMMIWPYHCMIGTEGSCLVPALAEAIHWLSIARGIQPQYEFKASVPQTDHYGLFGPVVPYPNHPQGFFNMGLLDELAQSDELSFAGETEDFCVKETMKQLLKYFGEKHPGALSRVNLLKDATSMVFPQNRLAADNFLQEMADKGVKITTTKEF